MAHDVQLGKGINSNPRVQDCCYTPTQKEAGRTRLGAVPAATESQPYPVAYMHCLPWLASRLVAQKEFARQLFTGTDKVRNKGWLLFLGFY